MQLGSNQCKNCDRFKSKLISSPITKELNEMYNLKDGKGKNCNGKWNSQKLKKKKSHNITTSSTPIPSTSLLNDANDSSTQLLSQLDLSAASLENFPTITTNSIPVNNVPQSLQTISSATSSTALVLENSPLGGLVVLRVDQRQPLLDFSR